jgi:transcriptional regulator with XRE-family HTH domain
MPKNLDVRKLLAMNLKRARLNMGLSQLALATELEMAHNFINDIEHGKKWVSPDTIEKLCAALKIDAYQLFLPDNDIVADKDAAIAACCDDILEETKKVVARVRAKHIGK